MCKSPTFSTLKKISQGLCTCTRKFRRCTVLISHYWHVGIYYTILPLQIITLVICVLEDGSSWSSNTDSGKNKGQGWQISIRFAGELETYVNIKRELTTYSVTALWVLFLLVFRLKIFFTPHLLLKNSKIHTKIRAKTTIATQFWNANCFYNTTFWFFFLQKI